MSLSKKAPGLKQLLIGLGWDVNQSGAAAFDLDACAFLLAENGKCPKSKGAARSGGGVTAQRAPPPSPTKWVIEQVY